MMTGQEIVSRAREILRQCGWIQFHGHSPYGYCTWGALVSATTGYHEPAFVVVVQRLQRQLGLAEECSSRPIACWNDYPGRTYAEVDAALAELQASLAEAVPEGELVCA